MIPADFNRGMINAYSHVLRRLAELRIHSDREIHRLVRDYERECNNLNKELDREEERRTKENEEAGNEQESG